MIYVLHMMPHDSELLKHEKLLQNHTHKIYSIR